MEILFRSEYERTPKFYREIYFYNHFKRPFNIMLMLCMMILLVANLFFAIRDSWHDFMSNVSVGIGIVFFVLYILAYPVMVHLARKRDEESNSKTETKTYILTVTEDKIINTAPSGIEIEVRYAKISKIRQSKHYILFISEENLTYAMSKENFTVGTYDGLIKFLRSKNYKV